MNQTLSRRAVLRIGTSSIFGALAARWCEGRASASQAAKAQACILLWLNGGPSHIDTFDPKPGRPTAGLFKAIKARAPAMMLSEGLPRLAERGNKIALVRSMSSKEGNHVRAQYYVHTSYAPTPTLVHPSLGGWACAKLGDRAAELPAFVSIGGPSLGAGFLGVQNGPFTLSKGGAPPPDIGLPHGVDLPRFERRQAALEAMEDRFAKETGDAKIIERREVYAKAERLMRAPKLDGFDLAGESQAAKAAYGDTDFGRGCLVARRLVERGVKFVEVVLDGWDTHQNGFERNRALMATLDPAFAALLDDLSQRDLLKSTIVACMGEFGRTPRINATEGRDHWPQAWSAVLAGGGVRGGVVHGGTDEDGMNVAGPPTRVPDLLATIAGQLGLDPGYTEMTPAGRPISVTDGGTPIRALLV
jgi:uncharacterized protein DUF1501